MRVRNPAIDFESSVAGWIPSNVEIALMLNAVSSYTGRFETFAIRVMGRALRRLPAALRDDVTVFVRQEAAHKHYHEAFNVKTWHDGGELLAGLDRRLEGHFSALERDRGMEDLTAYVEAVESIGVIYAHFFYEIVEPRIGDADPAVLELWSWHFAEEFEHRMVPHRVFRAFNGCGEDAHLRRIAALEEAYGQMKRHAGAVGEYMLAHVRAGMSPSDTHRSIEKQISYFRALDAYFSDRLAVLSSVQYDPSRDAPPAALRAYLDRYDRSADQ